MLMKNLYVSYPGHGLGRVIEYKTLNGVEFVRMQILSSDLIVMVPRDSDAYRPLMSRETAEKVNDLLKMPNDFNRDSGALTWKRRFNKLLDKVKSNNPILMAEVVAELNNRAADGELSYGERKLRDAARSLLETELELIGEKEFSAKT